MSRKAKGINAERELVHKFWSVDWACVRIAGSGSSSYPCPDLLAGNAQRKVAIECKVSKEPRKYLTPEDIDQLEIFSKKFGAEPWIGVKMNKEWFFLMLEDIEKPQKNFAITYDLCLQKGLSFEELTS